MRHFSACLATFAFALIGCRPPDSNADGGTAEHFSFFVTSLRALQELSDNQNGFGGDLRFGESGPGAGLRGADKICAAIAERSMPGASAKQWRAFLSAADDGTGNPVHAIGRIGTGPWYDRMGRLLAPSYVNLLNTRPQGGDVAIADDFPNEDGVPNHAPDPTQGPVDNHDMLTGTNERGQLYSATSTCLDWTSNTGDVAREGRPRVGHSWPRAGFGIGGDGGMLPVCDPNAGFVCDGGFGPLPEDGSFPFPGDGGFPFPPDGGFGFEPPGRDGGFGFPGGGSGMSDIDHWMSSLDESGCAPGVNLIEMGGPQVTSNTVGSGGGYGGFYCFALTP